MKRAKADKEVHRRYREILGRRRLSDAQIGRMRSHVRLLAQAICEHAWRQKAF